MMYPSSQANANSNTPSSSSSTTTAKRSCRPPPGHAVPILCAPYSTNAPSRTIHTNTFTLPSSQNTGGEQPKLGVRFRWNGSRSDRVVITAVDTDSAVYGVLQPDDVVLAVNNVPATKPSLVGDLFRSAHDTLTFTTLRPTPPLFLQQQDAVLPPYTYVQATPSYAGAVPLQVTSTRGRCLVQISRLFPLGGLVPTTTTSTSTTPQCHEGDIVLSLQGVPVSQPAHVDRVLLETTTTQSSSYVWLYAVDMAAYRTSIAMELRNIFPAIGWHTATDNRRQYWLTIGRTKRRWELVVDSETQYVQLVPATTSTHRLGGQQAHLLDTYLAALNQGMEDRMRVLEEVVCCQAFTFQSEWLAGRGGEDQQQREASPVDCSSSSSRSRTSSSSSSSEVVQQEDQQQDQEASVMATAVVLPLAALQTQEERQNYASTMSILGN